MVAVRYVVRRIGVGSDSARVCPGDMEEFVRRYPSVRLWDEDCRVLGPRVYAGEYDALPERMKCAVGSLAYRDDWLGGSTWSRAVTKHRELSEARSAGGRK